MDNMITSPEGNVSLRINEDKMSAWMYVHKTSNIIDEREILSLIEKAGIVYGVEAALEWMSENGYNKDYDKPFPVAICKVPTERGKLKVLFNVDTTYNPLKPVNLKDLQNWKAVGPGDVLAEISYDMNETGSPVYNIFGEIVTDVSNTDVLTKYRGEYVHVDKDSGKLTSGIVGYPYIDSEGKVCVLDKLVINKDVKFQKLTFNIPVSVVIEGNLSKSYLSVQQYLEVHGDIIYSDVFVDKDLRVKGSILHCKANGVIVNNNLNVSNIEDSLVICKGSMYFEKCMENSRVIANSDVIGNPEISSVSGSQVRSGSKIDIASLGNESGAVTEAEITLNPYLKERITLLESTLKAIENNPNIDKDKIEQVSRKIKLLEDELVRDMNEHLNYPYAPQKHVKIRHDLYKGVYIRVLSKSYPIKHKQFNVEFTEA